MDFFLISFLKFFIFGGGLLVTSNNFIENFFFFQKSDYLNFFDVLINTLLQINFIYVLLFVIVFLYIIYIILFKIIFNKDKAFLPLSFVNISYLFEKNNSYKETDLFPLYMVFVVCFFFSFFFFIFYNSQDLIFINFLGYSALDSFFGNLSLMNSYFISGFFDTNSELFDSNFRVAFVQIDISFVKLIYFKFFLFIFFTLILLLSFHIFYKYEFQLFNNFLNTYFLGFRTLDITFDYLKVNVIRFKNFIRSSSKRFSFDGFNSVVFVNIFTYIIIDILILCIIILLFGFVFNFWDIFSLVVSVGHLPQLLTDFYILKIHSVLLVEKWVFSFFGSNFNILLLLTFFMLFSFNCNSFITYYFFDIFLKDLYFYSSLFKITSYGSLIF